MTPAIPSNDAAEARDDRCVLAIDHGTSGIKAALVSARGEILDSDYESTPIHFLPGGGAEQDPEDWWRALVTAARRLVARRSMSPDRIGAVCVSSTFSSTVAVDADGKHLMPALTWMDSRGARHVRQVVGGFPSVLGYNVPRAIRWIRKTAGAPALSGKDDAAHALLVKNEYPEIYAKTRYFLPSKDYLNARLTGVMASSPDAMHLFWVTDARDPARIVYDDRLIGLLGIDRDKLPPLIPATQVVGLVLPEVADTLGLARSTPVVSGSADHQCALIGSGAVRDFEGHLYIGTSSWIECLVPFQKTDVIHSIASFPAAIPGKYQCLNEQDLAGGALAFLAENILFRRHALTGIPTPSDPYALVNEIASTVPAGSHQVIFTPWLNGERTPVDDIHVRGGFHNLSTTTTLEDMVRAVLEGVAYNTRWSLGYVEKFVGRPLQPLRLIGGGAMSPLWCQIFADVLDREILVAKDPRQANARGAAFLASIGLGWIRFEDIPGLVPIDATFRPNPATRALYDELFDVFVRFYGRTRALYHRLNRT
ncbi:MAG: FGGY-family carbohydrate kinase [bacterium]